MAFPKLCFSIIAFYRVYHDCFVCIGTNVGTYIIELDDPEEKYQHYDHGNIHAHAGMALDATEEKQVNDHLRVEQKEPAKNDLFERVKLRYLTFITKCMSFKKPMVITYLAW